MFANMRFFADYIMVNHFILLYGEIYYTTNGNDEIKTMDIEYYL